MDSTRFLSGIISEIPKNIVDKLITYNPKEIIARYKELTDLRERLKDEIQNEKEFQRTYNEQKEINEKQYRNLENNYKEQKDRFTAAALENAKKVQNPLIFQVDKIAGATEYVTKSRKNAKIIKLKAEYEEKMEKLEKLRRNVYCLDGDDFCDKYAINEEIRTNTQEITFPNELKRILNNSSKEARITSPYSALSDVSNIIHDIEGTENIETAVLTEKGFVPSHMEQNKSVDSLITDYFSFYDEQNAIVEEKRRNLEEINEEIARIDEERNSMAERISQTLEKHINQLKLNHFTLCVEIANHAHKQIQKAQTVIESLSRCLNSTDNKDIVANDAAIKILITQLSNDIKQIVERSKRMSLTQNITPIDVPSHIKYVVDEISSEHIARCSRSIEELKEVFEASHQYQTVILDELDDMIKGLRNIYKMNKVNFHEHTAKQPTITVDLERRREFNELRMKVLERQKEQLDCVGEMISSLPEFIKDLPVAEIKQEEEEIEKAEEKSNKEDSLTDNTFTAAPDPYAEANEIILERINEKEMKMVDKPYSIQYSSVFTPTDEAKTLFENISNKLSVEPLDFGSVMERKDKAEKELVDIIDAATTMKERRRMAREAMEERKKNIEELNKRIAVLREENEAGSKKSAELQEKVSSMQKKYKIMMLVVKQQKVEAEELEKTVNEGNELQSQKERFLEEHKTKKEILEKQVSDLSKPKET